jgi:hypothetical protein
VFNARSNKAETPLGQRKTFFFYSACAPARKDKEDFKIVVVMPEYGRIPVMFAQKDILITGAEQTLFRYYGRFGAVGKYDFPALQIAEIV